MSDEIPRDRLIVLRNLLLNDDTYILGSRDKTDVCLALTELIVLKAPTKRQRAVLLSPRKAVKKTYGDASGAPLCPIFVNGVRVR